MADLFQLLADPTRRRLVELTTNEERDVTSLVQAIGLTQPAISKQLTILRRGGLVEVRQEGRKRLYRARNERLRALRDWLDRYGPQWQARLDALEDHLDRM